LLHAIRGDKETVGARDLAAEDARRLAVRVDPIDVLDGAVFLVALLLACRGGVSRIGKVDAAPGVDGQIVRLVVGLAAELVGEATRLVAFAAVFRYLRTSSALPISVQPPR